MRLCPFDIFDIGEGSILAGVYQRGETSTINENHLLNGIANKMRQLDKSFKIRNTSYKKMAMLAKEFETRGWLKTKKNKEGHLMITDLEADG